LQKLAAARNAQLLQKCVAKKMFCKSLLLHNSNAQPLQKWLRNVAAVKARCGLAICDPAASVI
jgi:hypothetical protein